MPRFMKTLAAILLAAAAVLPVRAAEISFYFPVAVGGEVGAVVKGLVADFERDNPDIKVTTIYAGTYKETLAKALAADKQGKPPTVAILFAADIYTLIDAGAVAAFDDLVAAGEDRSWLDGFYPALMANSRVAGKTWGIPFQRSTILLYWNKDMFRQAGLDPDRPPADWSEMAAAARRLTHRDTSGNTTRWGLEIPASGFPYWLFQGLAAANGAILTNAAGTATHFDDPAAVDALAYWVDLSRRYQAHPPGVVEWAAAPSDFLREKAAMIWTTSGNLADIKAKASFDFGVAMLPAAKRRGTPTGGGNLYIFRKASPEQQRAALKLVRWLAAPAQTARWSIGSGYIAVRPLAWTTPAMKSHVADFPLATVARDQLEYAVAELSTHENQRVTATLDRALVAALAGAKTPHQALAEAQAEAERILLPYQR